MQPDKKDLELFKKWVSESSHIVFFGGAGVSTESGIPDFRSVDGLYHQKYDYPPETILSHSFFIRNPKEFYKFYRDKMLIENAKPNITHLKNPENFRQSSLKTSTDFTRQPEVRPFMSYTAQPLETTVKNVINFTM